MFGPTTNALGSFPAQPTLWPGKWLSNPNRSFIRKSCASRCGYPRIIVTSMRETRLYYKGAHQQAYERFETVCLAADEALLKRFVFLLGAERVVPEHRESTSTNCSAPRKLSGASSPTSFTPAMRTSASASSPAFAARMSLSHRPKSCVAPRSGWTGFFSAPFARTAACCPQNL